MSFDPNAHLTDIKGKQYLEVKWRLVWFREEHPSDEGWGIVTSEKEVTETSARFHAEITDPEGRVVATGTKTETKAGFGDFVEKAETGSIGRALALLGYGTQWCEELEEGERIVDAPVASTPAPTTDDAGRPLTHKELAKQMAALGIRSKADASTRCELAAQYLWDNSEWLELLPAQIAELYEQIALAYQAEREDTQQAAQTEEA